MRKQNIDEMENMGMSLIICRKKVFQSIHRTLWNTQLGNSLPFSQVSLMLVLQMILCKKESQLQSKKNGFQSRKVKEQSKKSQKNWLFLDFSWLKSFFFDCNWLSFFQSVTGGPSPMSGRLTHLKKTTHPFYSFLLSSLLFPKNLLVTLSFCHLVPWLNLVAI